MGNRASARPGTAQTAAAGNGRAANSGALATQDSMSAGQNTASGSANNRSASNGSGMSGSSAGGGYGSGGSGILDGAGAGSASAPRPMAAKKAILDDFIMLKTVGKGSFGKVVMVRKKDDNRIYAMKILKKEMVLKRRQYEHTLSERRILENIDHPYIVSLRFAFQTEHKLYMVFDFFNGGELYHYLSEGGRFGEERARFYAAEITLALDYLHRRGIVYRDLKPENLILDAAGHIRITDFGLSKEGVEGDTITSICGTPEYLAPEILRKRPYGMAVDWWSLGTLLYEMIAGLPPFYDRNRPAMYKKILESALVPPPDMSPEAVDLCSKMLIREPTARLGYRGAEEIKSHPFFRSIDWVKLEARELSPPWTPRVSDEMDTRNIASEFTSEPALVTPSPAGGRLRDMTGATPPSFNDFTFTHSSILDGNTYRVSLDEVDGAREVDRDGMAALRHHQQQPGGVDSSRVSSAGTGSEASVGFAPGYGGGGAGGQHNISGGGMLDRSGDDAALMGHMEGLRIS